MTKGVKVELSRAQADAMGRLCCAYCAHTLRQHGRGLDGDDGTPCKACPCLGFVAHAHELRAIHDMPGPGEEGT